MKQTLTIGLAPAQVVSQIFVVRVQDHASIECRRISQGRQTEIGVPMKHESRCKGAPGDGYQFAVDN